MHNHQEESEEFFKIFRDNYLINNHYKIPIAEIDYSCSIAEFTGTFKGPVFPGGEVCTSEFGLFFRTVWDVAVRAQLL
jgi:hypothetical protein